jgi:Ni/Co efflux regulator RcnB
MIKVLRLICAITSAGMLVPATIAYADPTWKQEHHNNKGKIKHQSKHEKHEDDGKVTIAIYDEDRMYIREYIGEKYHRSCPPGLAKKHNGCLPPGQAKKYVIGRPLTVAYEGVPDILLGRLHPVPAGYRYVMVDKDVLLISEASKKVIDAVTLLSAVGN